MNWFDLVLLAILLTCALTGVKIGLIRAGFMAGGVLIGWLVAAQYSGEIGDLLGNSLSNHTAITVVSYSIIIVVSVLISPKVAKLVKPLLTFLTLGLSSLMLYLFTAYTAICQFNRCLNHRKNKPFDSITEVLEIL